MELKTKGYENSISKSIRVYSNDPKNNLEILRLTAFVKVPLYVSPKFIRLRGSTDTPVTRTVTIRGERGRPLKLEVLHFDLQDQLAYRIEELKKDFSYQIHFTTIPGKHGKFIGSFRVKTSYEDRPTVSINIRFDIRKGKKKG